MRRIVWLRIRRFEEVAELGGRDHVRTAVQSFLQMEAADGVVVNSMAEVVGDAPKGTCDPVAGTGATQHRDRPACSRPLSPFSYGPVSTLREDRTRARARQPK